MVKGDISLEEEADELIKMFEDLIIRLFQRVSTTWRSLGLGITTLDLPFLTCSLRKETSILKLHILVTLSMNGT